MAKQHTLSDRNFDGLAGRFTKNVYGGLKGGIRLAVLARDFREILPIAPFAPSSGRPLRILDAGGGQGQFSLQLAGAGHQLVICDLSAEMLAVAREAVAAQGLEERVTLVHGALQALPEQLDDCSFDLVLCHAVMEWLAKPEALLPCLRGYLRPGGWLSLTFYNLNSLIYKNLLRTNFRKIRDQDYGGARGSLTPISPLLPSQVEHWLQDSGFTLQRKSGIRVFHDYILDSEQRQSDPEGLLEMKLLFSLQSPYTELGRYLHMLASLDD